MFNYNKFSNCQRGSALVVALVILVVLTIMAISGMQVTNLQERMAGNFRDKELAFQAAEASLREAEMFLQHAVLPEFTLDCKDGLCSSSMQDYWLNSEFWSGDTSYKYEIIVNIDGISLEPRYIIEELPMSAEALASLAADEPISESAMYRVTARSLGGSEGAEVILQTTYKR